MAGRSPGQPHAHFRRPRRRTHFFVPVAAFSLLLAAVLALPFPAANANVFGVDNRRPLYPADHLNAVGTIACEGSTRRPTGSLIALGGMDDARDFDIVITVAHAFIPKRGDAPERCLFLPGGRWTEARAIRSVEVGTDEPSGNWSADWAVAVIERVPETLVPLEPRIVSPDAIDELEAAGAGFKLVGNEGENGPLSVSEACGPVPKRRHDFRALSLEEFLHDCDMGPGWSGGPLIMLKEQRAYVIAVNATAVNAIASRKGAAFDGRFNPNTAVRIDGAFWSSIRRNALRPATGVEWPEEIDAYAAAPLQLVAADAR